jgi:hypothetical protein
VSVEAVIVPASFGWVCLQLQYDGRFPPSGLLADLTRLGWNVPPPPSRPASAIDWETPDPLTGQRFSVRPWRALHDIDPPGRPTARASWDADRRAAALRALAPVFSAHQVTVRSSVPELAQLALAAPPPDVADTPALVSFSAPVGCIEPIEVYVRSLGLPHHVAVEVRKRREMYRGSVSERAVPTLVGQILVPCADVGSVQARLREELATVEVRTATDADAERLRTDVPAAGAAPDTSAVAPAPGVTVPYAVVQVAIPVDAEFIVKRIVDHPVLVGLPVTVTPDLAVPSRPGSQRTVEVVCPPGMASLVRTVLAGEAGAAEEAVVVRLHGA